jgi:hypothetical protein
VSGQSASQPSFADLTDVLNGQRILVDVADRAVSLVTSNTVTQAAVLLTTW